LLLEPTPFGPVVSRAILMHPHVDNSKCTESESDLGQKSFALPHPYKLTRDQ